MVEERPSGITVVTVPVVTPVASPDFTTRIAASGSRRPVTGPIPSCSLTRLRPPGTSSATAASRNDPHASRPKRATSPAGPAGRAGWQIGVPGGTHQRPASTCQFERIISAPERRLRTLPPRVPAAPIQLFAIPMPQGIGSNAAPRGRTAAGLVGSPARAGATAWGR